MNNSTSTKPNIIVSPEELQFLEGVDHLTEADIEDTLLHKELIEKLVNHAIRNIRFGMINLQFKSKEEVELQIGALIAFREGIGKTTVNYKEYKADIAKAKEVEEELRSQEEIEDEKKMMDIKNRFNI